MYTPQQHPVTLKQLQTQFGPCLSEWIGEFRKVYEEIRQIGNVVWGYGSSGRANSICTYLDIALDGMVDDAPEKISSFMPVSHLQIQHPDTLFETAVDASKVFVIVLAWPYAVDIIQRRLSFLERGGTFVIPLPKVQRITNANVRDWLHAETQHLSLSPPPQPVLPVVPRVGFYVAACIRTAVHRTTCVDCVASIRHFHPHAPIIVVMDPSSSPFETFELEPVLKTLGATVDRYAQPVAADMMMQMLFLRNRPFERAIFLQDSMRLIRAFDIDECAKVNTIRYLWHFLNHRSDWSHTLEPPHLSPPGVVTHDDLIMYCATHFIANSEFQSKFPSLYWNKGEWVGCFGCLSILNHQFAEKMEASTGIFTTMTLMGTSNRKRRAIESIYSVAVDYTLGEHVQDSLDNFGRWTLCSNHIVKLSMDRQ
jgi:hypothetical protein